jgi:hypothetical protein
LFAVDNPNDRLSLTRPADNDGTQFHVEYQLNRIITPEAA